jgi:hypothetical protein
MVSKKVVARYLALVLAPLTICLASCTSADVDPTDDDWDSEDPDSASSDVSMPDDWTLPPDVREVGNAQYVKYDGAPNWNGQRSCGGSLLAGTRELGGFLKDRFPAMTRYGGYTCRPNSANTSKVSVHGTGRALDLMIPLDGRKADNERGDEIANWLVENAENIGIQLIIWDRTIWNGSRSGEKARHYTGPHAHNDHIHIELTQEAARKNTPFFVAAASSEADTATAE